MSERLTYYACSNALDIKAALQEQGVAREACNRKQLDNTINHAIKIGTKHIIVQRDVQDRDYTSEYHAYHGRLFYNIDRFCIRVHCFSEIESVDCDNVLEIIDAADTQYYCGFITIRPVKSFPVGATILRPEATGGHYILSRDSFDVHIAGKTFSVVGTPFMQQDNAVGACASASIWMSLRTLRKKEGLSAFTPAQITNMATKYIVRGRTLPNREGLEVTQMVEAIRSAGYSPSLLSFRDKEDSVEIKRQKIYPYIESELPVILGIFPPGKSAHAVVVIGHGWKSNSIKLIKCVGDRKDNRFIHASSWSVPFIIHNDNTGPYNRLGTSEYKIDDVKYAIPLLPSQDVYINAEEAEIAALSTINALEDAIKDIGLESPLIQSKKYVLRVYLQDKHSFRIGAMKSGMNQTLVDRYRTIALPKRVWIAEINQYEGYGEKDFVRLGEVVIDPTGDPYGTPYIVAHIPGYLLLNGETIIRVENDHGYKCYQRDID